MRTRWIERHSKVSSSFVSWNDRKGQTISRIQKHRMLMINGRNKMESGGNDKVSKFEGWMGRKQR